MSALLTSEHQHTKLINEGQIKSDSPLSRSLFKLKAWWNDNTVDNILLVSWLDYDRESVGREGTEHNLYFHSEKKSLLTFSRM